MMPSVGQEPKNSTLSSIETRFHLSIPSTVVARTVAVNEGDCSTDVPSQAARMMARRSFRATAREFDAGTESRINSAARSMSNSRNPNSRSDRGVTVPWGGHPAPRERHARTADGRMLLFNRNTFCGSYRSFTMRNRRMTVGEYAVSTSAASSAERKFG